VIAAFLCIERRAHEVAFIRKYLADAEWYSADLAVSSLGDVVLHKHWAVSCPRGDNPTKTFWPPPHPRTVREFAARRESTTVGFGFDEGRDPFEYRPILVATSFDGPRHIAEGSHRSDAIWRAHLQGHARFQGTMRVILGVHPAMRRWIETFSVFA
jgi:hypothetical protein